MPLGLDVYVNGFECCAVLLVVVATRVQPLVGREQAGFLQPFDTPIDRRRVGVAGVAQGVDRLWTGARLREDGPDVLVPRRSTTSASGPSLIVPHLCRFTQNSPGFTPDSPG